MLYTYVTLSIDHLCDIVPKGSDDDIVKVQQLLQHSYIILLYQLGIYYQIFFRTFVYYGLCHTNVMNRTHAKEN